LLAEETSQRRYTLKNVFVTGLGVFVGLCIYSTVIALIVLVVLFTLYKVGKKVIQKTKEEVEGITLDL